VSYRVAIVGAGRIGAFLDNPQGRQIRTHAHAYRANGQFEIAGFMDCDWTRAKTAAQVWGGRPFNRIEELVRESQPDVISICLPDKLHYETLLALANLPLKLIFLEKPAVMTVSEGETIRPIYQQRSTRILVNYTRRFVPQIQQLREKIWLGEYGCFLSGTGHYGKGLLHNGSHLLDLVLFFLGEPTNVRKLAELADYSEDDPSVSAELSWSNGGRFLLRHIDCRKFEIFEMDLIFEKKRIRICDLGTRIEEMSVEKHQAFPDYRTTQRDVVYPTDQSGAMSRAVTNIRNNLEHDESLLCTLVDGLAAVAICSKIRESPLAK
jgi:predicted dehydrogenase